MTTNSLWTPTVNASSNVECPYDILLLTFKKMLRSDDLIIVFCHIANYFVQNHCFDMFHWWPEMNVIMLYCLPIVRVITHLLLNNTDITGFIKYLTLYQAPARHHGDFNVDLTAEHPVVLFKVYYTFSTGIAQLLLYLTPDSLIYSTPSSPFHESVITT